MQDSQTSVFGQWRSVATLPEIYDILNSIHAEPMVHTGYRKLFAEISSLLQNTLLFRKKYNKNVEKKVSGSDGQSGYPNLTIFSVWPYIYFILFYYISLTATSSHHLPS